MSPPVKDKWFVLHCETDDSHVLVAADSVICEDSVKTEEKVKFLYPGCKDFLTGIVKGISGMSGLGRNVVSVG